MFVFSLLVTLAGYAASWILEEQLANRKMVAEENWTYGFGGLSYDSASRLVGEVVEEGEYLTTRGDQLDIYRSCRVDQSFLLSGSFPHPLSSCACAQ